MRNNLFYNIGLKGLFVVLLICPVIVSAQDNQVYEKEIGLRFSGFDDFNLMYKKLKSPDRYWRHRVLNSRLSYHKNRRDVDFGLFYAFGAEKRKPIGDKVQLVTGWDLATNLIFSNSDNNLGDRITNITVAPAIGVVLGVQIDLQPRVRLSAEVIPALQFTYGSFQGSENDYSANISMNSSSTALTIMYAF